MSGLFPRLGFLITLLPAASPAALPPTLLKDIGNITQHNSSFPRQFIALGQTGSALFFARTSPEVRALCRTDGLSSGTSVVMGFPDPATASEPAIGEMAPLGQDAVFFKSGPGGQWELWKSNGTPAGTVLVKAVTATDASGFFLGLPTQLTPLPGRLVFAAPDSAHGTELWTTDGTTGGTVLLRDIAPGPMPGSTSPASSYPASLASTGSIVYFTADNGTAGSEPWLTDGTPAGTVPLIDLNPGPASSFPDGYTFSNGLIYFTAAGTGTYGEPPQSFATRDVWRTDGTTADTLRLIQLSEDDTIGGFVSAGPSTVFCKAHRSMADLGGTITETPGRFYITDGTPAGTTGYGFTNNQSLSPRGILGVLPGGAVIYTARGDGLFPRTTGRTALLTNGVMTELLFGNLQSSAFHGGSFYGVISRQFMPDTLYKYTPGALPDQRLTALTSAYGLALASAGDLLLGAYGGPASAPTGTEPYRVNPNGAITLLADLYPGSITHQSIDGPYHSINSSIRHPANLNGTLVFPAEGPTGLELWNSDGTSAGTSVCREIVPGPAGHRFNGFPVDAPEFRKWTLSGNRLFFVRMITAQPFGYELWSTDGTEPGTQPLIESQDGYFESMQPSAQGVWWIAQDSSVSPTRKTLWMSNGSPSGTRPVKDTGMSNDSGAAGAILAGTTYAILNGDDQSTWLWSLSPDPAKTLPLFNFRQAGDSGAWVRAMHVVDGALLIFVRRAIGSGGAAEIWKMLPGGLPQPVTALPDPGAYADIQTTLPGTRLVYFNATAGSLTETGLTGTSLWVTDGTAAGTRRATPPDSTLLIQYDARSRTAGDRLFVIHNGDAAGFEVWTCDGTSAGTRRLTGSIPPAEFLPHGGLADNLTVGGDGYVYFDSETVENDLRVRRIHRVSAANPGAPEAFGDLPENTLNLFGGTSLPRAVFYAHGRLYASCYTGEGGHEFYWWPAPAPATPFSSWIANQGLTPASADPLADPDRDGQPNLLEFLAGTQPASAASVAVPGIAASGSDGHSQTTFTFRRMETSGLPLIVESSEDCLTWQADHLITPDGTLIPQAGRRSVLLSRTGSSPETVAISTLPNAAPSRIFLRLRASLP